MDSVAFSTSSEDLKFVGDYSPIFMEKHNQKSNVPRRVLLVGLLLIILAICVVILFGCWYWLKPSSIQTVATNSTLSPTTRKIKLEMELMRQFVREMMLDSWNEYVRYAWGHEAVWPVLKVRITDDYYKIGDYPGLSIVASMSTLWTMGLKEEFERGKKWIETKLYLSKFNRNVNVFVVVTHYVGGLLSCYALTNDSMFLTKAKEIALLVEPAFNTPTGIPYQEINFNLRKSYGADQYLSEMSGFQVDFNYLSDVANETKYRNMINKIRQNLKKIEKPKNLFYSSINIENYWSDGLSSLSGLSREFYISLVKSYIQSNHLDVQSIEMYKEAMDAIEAIKMLNVSTEGFYYAKEYHLKDSHKYSDKIEYGTCYLGAMLSMGANAMQQALNMNSSIGRYLKNKELSRIHRHWEWAEKLTETCHVGSSRTKTGLGPGFFYLNKTPKFAAIAPNGYYLSSEFAESNFVLWRLTHDPKYRDYAWEMAQAIKRFCHVEGGGYTRIDNVNRIPTQKIGHQPVHFLSATLKYLYLTFTDDDVLPLDQWVFNAQGHPLPICGNNPVYPSQMCTNY